MPMYDRWSKVGIWIHDVSKQFIRKTVGYLGKRYTPIVKEKLEKGFSNPEIKLLYDNWTEIIEIEDYADKPEDANFKLFTQMRDIVCTILDEDSFYLLRFFYLMELFHRDYEKYNIEMHKMRAYWMHGTKKDVLYWPAIYAEIEKLKAEKNARMDRRDSDSGSGSSERSVNS